MAPTLADRLARIPSWGVTTGLGVVAALLLLRDLTVPERIFFDEVYYVDDARGYLATGVEPSFAVHPPLGKWLIALGIQVVGDGPVGWRLPGAVAGVLLVVVVHRLALRLLRDAPHGHLLALVAPLLLLFDGVFLVQARTAMLDIFLALFVGVGIWLLVVDRDQRRLGGDVLPPPGPWHWRWLAGVAFGCALAVKWSGLLGLGAGGLLVLTWELGLRRRTTGRLLARPGRLVAAVGLPLVALPLVVYAASWVPWAAGYEATSAAGCDEDAGDDDCTFSAAARVAGVWRHQDAMLDFHLGLEAEHPYRSAPITWPVLQRPVVYYYETCSADRAAGVPRTDDETGEVTEPDPCVVEQGEAGEIVLLGNPVTWWLFLAATPLLVAGMVRRDGRSAVAMVGWAGQFLPWLVVSRAAFLFYMVPAVPFQALGLAVAMVLLRHRGGVLWPNLGAVLGGVAGFGMGRAGALLLEATTLTPIVLTAGAGWVAGAVAGAAVGSPDPDPDRDDGGRDPQDPADDDGARGTAAAGDGVGPPRSAGPRERLLVPASALTVLALSFALFLYFRPVWVGEPLPQDQVNERWWFDSWV